MDQLTKTKIASNLALTAVLSGGLTIAVSLAYIVINVLALLFRNSCNAGSLATATGEQYFWTTIYNVYVKAEDCENSVNVLNITTEHTVFVFAIISLCMSAICLATAITLVSIIQDEKTSRYLNIVVFTYIGACVVSLVVDITAATFFGMDYGYLSTLLSSSLPGSSANYQTEVIRQGAFLFMGIALKGYVAHVINVVLLTLLAINTVQYKKLLKNDEHSIHKLGVLNAFDQRRQQEDNWSQPEMYSQSAGRSQGNHSFISDEEHPRTPIREPLRETARADYYSNRSFDRSDSWQPAQRNLASSSRPFSYLEDIKRPVATKPPAPPASPASPAPPAADASWGRDSWQNPPVPAPDYSPQPTRRLKSALKPAYM